MAGLEKITAIAYHLYRPPPPGRQNADAGFLPLTHRKIVRKVARDGLTGLDEEDRKTIARDIDLGNEKRTGPISCRFSTA